jgi:hypothetical protein
VLEAIVEMLRANETVSANLRRRDLSAWGTVERRGSGWSWRWSGLGLALPELLPEPVPCVSADAAWLAMDLTVSDYMRRIGAGG